MMLCSAADRGVGLCYCPGTRVILGWPLALKMINPWLLEDDLGAHPVPHQSTWTQIHFETVWVRFTVEQSVTKA